MNPTRSRTVPGKFTYLRPFKAGHRVDDLSFLTHAQFCLYTAVHEGRGVR